MVVTAKDAVVYRKALVVGGLKKYVFDTLAFKLARHGIGVAWHWPMDKEMSGTVPAECEVVVLLEDMTRNANDMRKYLKSATKKLGIKLIASKHNGTLLTAALEKDGFEQQGYTVTSASVPAEPLSEVQSFRRDGVLVALPTSHSVPIASAPLNPTEFPAWLRTAMETGSALELTPEREAELFELSRTRTFTVSVFVTTQLAERWVDAQGRNTRNRKLIQRKVDQLTRAFKRGEYRKSHQGLAFGRDGTIQDGQHRLWAVWLSEQPVPFDFQVTFGQTEDVIPIIDDVTKRTIGANRQIRTGDALSKRKVEAVTMIHYLLNKTGSLNTTPSYDECDSYISMFQAGVDWAATLPRKARVSPASVRGALAFAYKAHPEKVMEFAEQVIEGIGLKKGQPAHTLRSYLETCRATGSSSIRREISVKTLRACLAHLGGDDMPKLYATEEAVAYFAKAHGITLDGSGYRIPKPEDPTAAEAMASGKAAT